MNDLELIELVAGTDAYVPGAPLPELFDGRGETLREIERRAHMDTNDKITPIPVGDGDDSGGRWRGAWLAAAVFVGAIVLVGAAAAIISSDTGGVADSAPSSTAAPDPEAAVSGAEALAVADAYFAAYAAGDLDAAMELLVEDETSSTPLDASAIEDVRRSLAYDLAQEIVQGEPSCVVTFDPGRAGVATVLCSLDAQPHLASAVGAPPVDSSVTLEVNSDERVVRFSVERNPAAWRSFYNPFIAWMKATHPEDVALVECCEGATVEEAIERGEARVFYADLWAAYLEENGCVWNEPCEP